MKWSEITSQHHACRAVVSLLKLPDAAAGPFYGIICCKTDESYPYLMDGNLRYSFAGWWDVQIVGSQELQRI